jgi:glycosyltransferase involved in cell wall biosynthesis
LAIAELACSQSAQDHNVTVVTSRTAEGDYGNYPQWLTRLESSDVQVLQTDSTFKRDGALNDTAFQHIRDTVDVEQLSVIHSHAAIPSMLGLRLRSIAKRFIPVLQTMHGWGIRKDEAQSINDIALMNGTDAIVVPSIASRRLLERLGIAPHLVRVVPYGIPPLPPTAAGGGIEALHHWKSCGYVVLVCTGTVGPRKNQCLLIEALAHPEAPKNLACAVVGEGEEVSTLSLLIEQSGMQDRVRMFGFQPDAARFLSAADWFILPSMDEGLPLSVLEAYRAGVPVIGSDIAEIAEVICPGQTGYLFAAGEVESLVKTLRRAANLSESERLKMGSLARRMWQDHYSLERMLEGYAAVYDALL